VAPARGRVRITRELGTNETAVTVVRNLGAIRIAETALELQALGSESYRVSPDDPSTAFSDTSRLAEFRRDDWHARIESSSSLIAEGDSWRLRANLTAHEENEEIFCRHWDLLIPRYSRDE